MLREDSNYINLLSEKIILTATKLPPSVKFTLPVEQNEVDPIVTLHALVNISLGDGDTYSHDALVLSTTIVGTAFKCMSLKRMVVHLLLALKMMKLEADTKQHVIRILVFAHVIPYHLNMLSTFGEQHYTELLKLYNELGVITSEKTEYSVRDGYEKRLADQLEMLNSAVKISCSKSSPNKYFEDMGLTLTDPKNHPGVITNEQTVAEDLTLPVIVDLLKENENIVIDQFEAMPLFKGIGLDTWKTLLNVPDLPPNENDFKRRPRPSYYEEFTTILNEAWITPPADAGTDLNSARPGSLKITVT